METMILLPIIIAIYGMYRIAIKYERSFRQEKALKTGSPAAIIAKADAFLAAEGLDTACFSSLVKAGRSAQEAGDIALARRALHLCLVAVADTGGDKGAKSRDELADRLASLPNTTNN